MVDTIKVRTRVGKGVDNGKLKKLKPLSTSYIKLRELYESNLSSLTKPNKSGLTATGQMLDSIRFKISGLIRKKIIIFFDNKRSGELSGAKSRLTNSQVAKHVQDNGRPFFEFADTEVKRFTRRLRKKITDTIRRAL